MATGDYPQSGSIIITMNKYWNDCTAEGASSGDWEEYVYNPSRQGIITGITEWEPKNNKKGDDDMRYLYEVILVNPKNDDFYTEKTVKKSETSAIMHAYRESPFSEEGTGQKTDFDDLKTSCRVLMEWKKEKSLKKAIETIKEAVE